MNVRFLREAIRLSIEKMEQGAGGPFGALVVKDDQIVGRGWNGVTSLNDPTAHAEIMAIRDACKNLGTYQLDGCVLYASCEPCPMCLSAIYWARISRLYFAASRQDAAASGFDDEYILQELRQDWATRALPAKQELQAEARVALDQWTLKVNRLTY